MLYKSENLPPKWDDIDNECQQIPSDCPWTNTSAKATLTVVITCLKWTFNYDFRIKVTAHPEGKPNTSKQMNISQHHPLPASLSEALNDYEDFPEPHLNSHRIHNFGELLDFLFRRYNPHNGQYSSCLS